MNPEQLRISKATKAFCIIQGYRGFLRVHKGKCHIIYFYDANKRETMSQGENILIIKSMQWRHKSRRGEGSHHPAVSNSRGYRLKGMVPQEHGCEPHQFCLVFWLEPGIMVEGLGSFTLVWPGWGTLVWAGSGNLVWPGSGTVGWPGSGYLEQLGSGSLVFPGCGNLVLHGSLVMGTNGSWGGTWQGCFTCFCWGGGGGVQGCFCCWELMLHRSLDL